MDLACRRAHRGKRSSISLLRRRLPRWCRALPGTVPGESGTASPVSVAASQPDTLVIYSINIRCLLSNLTELTFQINRLQPHMSLCKRLGLILVLMMSLCPVTFASHVKIDLTTKIEVASYALLKKI